MRKPLRGALLASLLGAVVPAFAAPYIITDNYWGANDRGYGDVIGSSFFDIAQMTVGYSGHEIYVTVFTNYASPDPRALGTTYGDLFISTDGWHPYGTAANHYKYDNWLNGEDWEFVFDTSKGKVYGGTFSTLLSDDMHLSGTYRNGQEVLRDRGGTAVDEGEVSFGTATVSGHLYNTITYEFDWTALGVSPGDELAFRWQMTCANDVIEGSGVVAPVPEPLTPLLLATGLAGLGVRRRNKNKKR